MQILIQLKTKSKQGIKMSKKNRHKIEIEHFLFLRNINLEINDFTLMIGEQSAGKSSICKLIFLFRSIRSILLKKIIEIYEDGELSEKNLVKREIMSYFNKETKDLYVKLFGESYGMNMETKVTYFYDKGKTITLSICKEERRYLDFHLGRSLQEEITNLTMAILGSNIDDRPKGFFIDKHYHQKIDDELKRIFNDHLDSYYIPAGRNMFSLLQGQLATLQTNNFDYTNELFFFHLERFTSLLRDGLLAFAKQRGDNEAEKIAKSIINHIGGEIRKVNGELSFVINNDSKNLLLKFISSGQQEVMWIFYLLFIWITCKDQVFVIIEEPEAHIHPTLQKEIMNFVAYFINQTKSQVILTTHSPYILASANLLHYAGFLKSKGIKVDDIIPSDNCLTPENCHFFEMKKNTQNEFTMQEIIEKDEDGVFVQVERIDYVSSNIEEDFSRLFQKEIE